MASPRVCRPTCLLAHDLVNLVAAIVAHCDLVEMDTALNSPFRKHVEKIKDLALTMAEILLTRTCNPEAESARSALPDGNGFM